LITIDHFLTARWRHLVLVNYAVQPDLLAAYVPDKTRVDQFEGRVLVSLVAFMFEQTRVLGMPIPFHRTFEEVNLRFYVTPLDDPSRRGVTFIKEIVPRKAIPVIANRFFDEHYVALPMTHENAASSHRYSWMTRNWQTVSVDIAGAPSLPEQGSIDEFITEHYWGYSKGRRRTLEYRVEHPQWKCCEVDSFRLSVDFADTYGEAFGFLSTQEPFNVLYAEGSEVSVSFPGRLD